VKPSRATAFVDVSVDIEKAKHQNSKSVFETIISNSVEVMKGTAEPLSMRSIWGAVKKRLASQADDSSDGRQPLIGGSSKVKRAIKEAKNETKKNREEKEDEDEDEE
jgi:translation initiation factor 2B subunit (eIF-2B alpha/beta/delta family)